MKKITLQDFMKVSLSLAISMMLFNCTTESISTEELSEEGLSDRRGERPETVEGTTRTIIVNNIPSHLVGDFPNSRNPNVIYSENDADNQLISTYTMTTEPTLAGNVTSTGGFVSGVLFSGVGLEVQTNETYVNTATGTANRDWNLVALQDARNLGLDCNNAHVQPTGQYHYHAAPTAYVNDLGIDGTQMVKIGYAGDGFPIYYKYGYADDGVSIVAFESGYSLIEGERPGDGGDSPDGCYDGSYSQDYEFIAENSELDECNGRTGRTPESDSEYYYVITDNYPSAPICFSGTPDNSFSFGGQGGGGETEGEPGGEGGPGGM